MKIQPLANCQDFMLLFAHHFGEEMANRLRQLENNSRSTSICLPLTEAEQTATSLLDCDVVLVGAGLSLILVPLLLQRGLQVAVLDQGRVGFSHREWNASYQELQLLVDVGFCNEQQLQQFIVHRYRYGICRWHQRGCYPVTGVLDCAVDAQMLLSFAKQQAIALGATIFEYTNVVKTTIQPDCVLVTGICDHQATQIRAAMMLDGRGASSPYVQVSDLVCPTVGGVVCGLEHGIGCQQINAEVGEILVTTEDVEEGHQYVWEAFPLKNGLVTVYLFYYCQRQKLPVNALQKLYERFMARLSDYKKGAALLERPTFGFIPGWSRLTNLPSQTPHPRIRLIGDAAARHSPLTYCGFGAMLRALQPVVDRCVCPSLKVQPANRADTLHTITGALALMMATPSRHAPASVNTLLDHAFAALHRLGNTTYAGLLQDALPPPQLVPFLREVAYRYPQVYRQTWQVLGTWRTLVWGSRICRLALAS